MPYSSLRRRLTITKIGWQHFSMNKREKIFITFKNKYMSSGKIITGILIGAAAGSILGILFAPDKGSETRKKLVKKGTDFTDELKDKFGELVDNVAAKFEGVHDDAEELAEHGKKKIKSLKEEASKGFA
jgi:gas vesicle protein